MTAPLYDRIGDRYASTRHPDPHIAARILAALGDARRVLNVGAGAGSYEPTDRTVVAVEPSPVMLAQRSAGAPPAVRAVAESLPFPDRAFDAAMAVLTLHHWTDQRAGIAEVLRVAPRLVVLTFDMAMLPWIATDYLPAMIGQDAFVFPPVTEVAAWFDAGGRGGARPPRLHRRVRRRVLGPARAVPRSRAARRDVGDPQARPGRGRCRDGNGCAPTSRPAPGTTKWGHLRDLPELDLGYRLLVGPIGGASDRRAPHVEHDPRVLRVVRGRSATSMGRRRRVRARPTSRISAAISDVLVEPHPLREPDHRVARDVPPVPWTCAKRSIACRPVLVGPRRRRPDPVVVHRVGARASPEATSGVIGHPARVDRANAPGPGTTLTSCPTACAGRAGTPCRSASSVRVPPRAAVDPRAAPRRELGGELRKLANRSASNVPAASAASTAQPGSDSCRQSRNRQASAAREMSANAEAMPTRGRAPSPRLRRPGVSITTPPVGIATRSRAWSSCAGRGHRSARTAAVARRSSSSSALMSVDLPAPDGPSTHRGAVRREGARDGVDPGCGRGADVPSTSTPRQPLRAASATSASRVEIGLGDEHHRLRAGSHASTVSRSTRSMLGRSAGQVTSTRSTFAASTWNRSPWGSRRVSADHALSDHRPPRAGPERRSPTQSPTAGSVLSNRHPLPRRGRRRGTSSGSRPRPARASARRAVREAAPRRGVPAVGHQRGRRRSYAGRPADDRERQARRDDLGASSREVSLERAAPPGRRRARRRDRPRLGPPAGGPRCRPPTAPRRRATGRTVPARRSTRRGSVRADRRLRRRRETKCRRDGPVHAQVRCRRARCWASS